MEKNLEALRKRVDYLVKYINSYPESQYKLVKAENELLELKFQIELLEESLYQT